MSDRRKLSEAWTKSKADEFVKMESELTFSEWCYEQGKADGKALVLEEVKNKAQELIVPEYDERDENFNYGVGAVIAIIEELEERR